MARALTLTPSEAARHGLALRKDGQRRSAFELLSYPDIGIGDLARIWPGFGELDCKIAEQIEIDAKYEVYLSRQAADVESYRRDESIVLPDDIDYAALPGLSNEVRHKLQAHRPRTIGHAGRIDGITPAALTLLAVHVRRQRPQARSRRGMIAGGRRRRHGAHRVLCGQLLHAPAELAADRARALALTPVSRETAARLDRFVAVLLEWQRRINLIAPSTEPKLWTRHVADSLQLLALAPQARIWVDLGSGGGFPGPGDCLRARGYAWSAGASRRKQCEESRLSARSGAGDWRSGGRPCR